MFNSNYVTCVYFFSYSKAQYNMYTYNKRFSLVSWSYLNFWQWVVDISQVTDFNCISAFLQRHAFLSEIFSTKRLCGPIKQKMTPYKLYLLRGSIKKYRIFLKYIVATLTIVPSRHSLSLFSVVRLYIRYVMCRFHCFCKI